MSIAGGPGLAIDRALSVDCTALQVFVKNNMQWFAKPFPEKELALWREHPERARLGAIFGHTGYLINLAAKDPATHEKSQRSLEEELVRADQLGLPFLVLHPGAHLGVGEEAGLEKVAKTLDAIFAKLPDVRTRVALEITAGQGSCLGYRFEHLAAIIAQVQQPDRLVVCLDTAHLFAAGYDIATEAGFRGVMREFDRVVGKERLAAFHLNDSKTGLGSRVDRHEAIGKGKIGLEPFRVLMNQARYRGIPKVLETPKGKDLQEDRANLATLRGLVEA